MKNVMCFFSDFFAEKFANVMIFLYLCIVREREEMERATRAKILSGAQDK